MDGRNYQSRILYLVIYIRNEFRRKAISDEDKEDLLTEYL